MAFLSGNLALVLGALALIVTFLLRRLARDELLKRDLVGALTLFVVYVALRLGGQFLEPLVPKDWHPFFRVTWMLAFAFGSVRLGVALVLAARRRLRPGPSAKITRDVMDFLLYVVVAVPVLKTQLKIDITTLLGTSAVVSLVLGFALQDTLSNVFAGISLQLERPFDVGDFIRVGEHEGRVVQIAWRSTRIETVRRELISVPNSQLAKEHLISFSAPGGVATELDVNAAYGAPPNLVKAEVAETLREVPLVLKEPAPWVRVKDFGDSAITYRVRVYVPDYASLPHVRDEILSRLWYRFARAGIEIPFPQRAVRLLEQAPVEKRPASEVLARLELFAPFPAEELEAIAGAARERRFGVGEEIVTEGATGSTFFVVLSGRVSVRAGAGREVATLGRGQTFGEMSLLTGEPRSATVVAIDDTALLELDREAFATHFARHPERAAQLAALLERRRAELRQTAEEDDGTSGPSEAKMLDRLKAIFRLRA